MRTGVSYAPRVNHAAAGVSAESSSALRVAQQGPHGEFRFGLLVPAGSGWATWSSPTPHAANSAERCHDDHTVCVRE